METHHHLKKLPVPTHILHMELNPTNYNVLSMCRNGLVPASRTRLRDIRNEYKSKKPSLSGKGKLTDKVINSMQNYFGQAIRSNKGNLYQMEKAVGAILWHSTASNDEEYRHRFCPAGDSSWCSWQRSKSDIRSHQRIRQIYLNGYLTLSGQYSMS